MIIIRYEIKNRIDNTIIKFTPYEYLSTLWWFDYMKRNLVNEECGDYLTIYTNVMPKLIGILGYEV